MAIKITFEPVESSGSSIDIDLKEKSNDLSEFVTLKTLTTSTNSKLCLLTNKGSDNIRVEINKEDWTVKKVEPFDQKKIRVESQAINTMVVFLPRKSQYGWIYS